MTRLKIGVQLPEVEYEVTWPELVAMARAAEEAGLDSIWLGDHLLYDLKGVGPRGPWEVWTSLAALAMVTERVELGPLVASTSFHAPAMLAKLAATVDGASNGRLIVGLGAGWNQREYTAYGFPYDHRVDRFAEAFTIIRQLLQDGRCTFNGEHYSVDDCVLHPRPVRPGGPPLLLGSWRPRMLSIALPHVDMWNVWWSDYRNTPQGFAAIKAHVDAAARAIGREPSTLGATAAVYVQRPEGGGRTMGEYPGQPVLPVMGDAEAVAEHLVAMHAAGAAHVQLVLDPITRGTVEWLTGVVAEVRRAGV